MATPRRTNLCAFILYYLVCPAALIGGWHAPDARAQSGGNTTAAEALFEEGRKLMGEGNFAAACDKFEASYRIEPSVGALLNHANCRERNGQTATAWTLFRQAAASARKSGERKRESYALKRARRLKSKLSYLTVKVPEASRIDGLAITQNGAPVDPVLWDQATPIDPGTYQLKASADGYQTHTESIEIASESQQLTVEIPPLVEKPPPDPDDGDKQPPDVTPPPDDPVITDVATGMSGRKKLGLGTTAVGALGLAAGAVVGFLARGKWNDARDQGLCDASNVCNEDGVALADDARSLGNIANISFAVGGALVITGAILWLTAPSGRAQAVERLDSTATRVAPMLGPGVVGLDMTVRF